MHSVIPKKHNNSDFRFSCRLLLREKKKATSFPEVLYSLRPVDKGPLFCRAVRWDVGWCFCFSDVLEEGWATLLAQGPHWVLKFDRQARAISDGWRMFMSTPINYIKKPKVPHMGRGPSSAHACSRMLRRWLVLSKTHCILFACVSQQQSQVTGRAFCWPACPGQSCCCLSRLQLCWPVHVPVQVHI